MNATHDIITLINQGLDNAAIVAELTDNPPASWYRTLTSREALDWLGGGGRYIALQTAANTLPEEHIVLRGACAATLVVIQRADVALDFSPGSEQWTMLQGCVQAGVFAADDVQALIASCRLIPTPTEAEVAEVRRHHDITTRIVAAYDAAIAARDNGESVEMVEAAMQAGWEGV